MDNGHRKRLRDKYLNQGFSGFYQDYEKLEFLLTFTIFQKDVKPIAKNLIETFLTIEGVLKAEAKELKKIGGLGDISICFLKFIADLNSDIFKTHSKKNSITISSKNEVIGYLKNEIGFENRENFLVLYLNSANQLLNNKDIESSVLFKGTLDRSAIYPREIIKKIFEQYEAIEQNVQNKISDKLENKNIILDKGMKKIMEEAFRYKAKSVILSHNHPSGNIMPSKADIDITKNMKKILNMVDIKLLDHIIVTKEAYFSFLEEGLLEV
ncbi:MAG: JAB domain-containing protein [Fusobacteriaceae bacterium]